MQISYEKKKHIKETHTEKNVTSIVSNISGLAGTEMGDSET